MTNTYLAIIWAALYIACAGLGFIAAPTGFLYGLCVIFSLLFFVPPVMLLYRGGKAKDIKSIRILRNLSILWLAVTMILLILNISSVYFSHSVGTILYYVLIVVTSPMVCSQYWLLPLFLWACLLVVSIQQLKQLRR